MKRVILHILNPYDKRSVPVDDEVTIGRSEPSDLIIDDSGLSRKNTSIFRDGDAVLIADENSTNGTFVNGRKVSGPPEELRGGDEIKIGSDTRIRVEIEGDVTSTVDRPIAETAPPSITPAKVPAAVKGSPPTPPGPKSERPPTMLIVAGLMTLVIVVGGLIVFLIISMWTPSPGTNIAKPTPIISKTAIIPVRVIDPLGGEDEDDLDDLIASWETPEDEINAGNVSDVSVASGD